MKMRCLKFNPLVLSLLLLFFFFFVSSTSFHPSYGVSQDDLIHHSQEATIPGTTLDLSFIKQMDFKHACTLIYLFVLIIARIRYLMCARFLFQLYIYLGILCFWIIFIRVSWREHATTWDCGMEWKEEYSWNRPGFDVFDSCCQQNAQERPFWWLQFLHRRLEHYEFTLFVRQSHPTYITINIMSFFAKLNFNVIHDAQMLMFFKFL